MNRASARNEKDDLTDMRPSWLRLEFTFAVIRRSNGCRSLHHHELNRGAPRSGTGSNPPSDRCFQTGTRAAYLGKCHHRIERDPRKGEKKKSFLTYDIEDSRYRSRDKVHSGGGKTRHW